MHKHRILSLSQQLLLPFLPFCRGVHLMVDPSEVILSVEFEVNLDGSSLS